MLIYLTTLSLFVWSYYFLNLRLLHLQNFTTWCLIALFVDAAVGCEVN